MESLLSLKNFLQSNKSPAELVPIDKGGKEQNLGICLPETEHVHLKQWQCAHAWGHFFVKKYIVIIYKEGFSRQSERESF